MTSLADRQHLLNAVEQAVQDGARREKACALVGISPRTLKRWRPHDQILSDRRPGASRPTPSHALTEEEKQTILAVCNQPEYSDLPLSMTKLIDGNPLNFDHIN